LVVSTGTPQTIEPILDYTIECPTHGSECAGHIEQLEGGLFLPMYPTPGTTGRHHPLMILKRACIQGTVTYLDYISGITCSMRGKKGVVRATNAMVVQGSIRMVISPLRPSLAGPISIPQYVADNTKIMTCLNGTYSESHIQNGDYGILISL
jgi:hypothetical protein